MTVMLVYQTRIECDACGMVVAQSATTPEGLDQKKYEGRLVEAGWVIPKNGMHYCPRCIAAIHKPVGPLLNGYEP